MSRYGKMGKYKHRSGGPPRDFVIGTVKPAAEPSISIKPPDAPGTLRMGDLLDWEHRFGRNPGWTVGTGLHNRVVIDDSPPGVVRSTGMYEKIFD